MTNPVVEEAIAKTFRELEEVGKPIARSRISTTPNGFIHLVAWSNASLLRILIIRFTDTLPRSQHRLKAQLDDAARSVIANIEEGFARPTTAEYLTFLGYSEASLVEVKGDIQRSHQDGILTSVPGSSLAQQGIDLGNWHKALRESVISKPIPPPKILQNPLKSSKGLYRNVEDAIGKNSTPRLASSQFLQHPVNPFLQPPSKSFKFLYPPVDDLRAQDLTYEIFIELINKTSWHLRKIVVSLENKLAAEGKYYQVEQLKLRSKLKFRR
ncbi:MAG TPA: four helix bundle protein [Patescibacteria group bacterium]|nr:four helix bundle protein [Patescibacteria group bacterium]